MRNFVRAGGVLSRDLPILNLVLRMKSLTLLVTSRGWESHRSLNSTSCGWLGYGHSQQGQDPPNHNGITIVGTRKTRLLGKWYDRIDHKPTKFRSGAGYGELSTAAEQHGRQLQTPDWHPDCISRNTRCIYERESSSPPLHPKRIGRISKTMRRRLKRLSDRALEM